MGRIQLETRIAAPVERVFDLARDIDLHQSSMASSQETAISGRVSGLIELGETVTWRARHFGVVMKLTSRITALDPPWRFVDVQVDGPFASFRHEHRFTWAEGATTMTDDWTHASPLGWIGKIVDWVVLDRYLQRQLAVRSRAIQQAAESLNERAAPMGGDTQRDQLG